MKVLTDRSSIGINKVSLLSLIALIGYFLLPAFSPSMNRLLLVPFVCALLLYLVSVRPLYFHVLQYRRVMRAVTVATAFILMQYIYVVLGVSDKGTAPTFATIKFLILFLVMVPVYGSINRRQKEILLFFTVIFSIGVMMLIALTSSGGRPDPGELIQNQTTQFATGTMFLSGVMFSAFLTAKKTSEKHLAAILVFICVLYNLLVSQKGIVLVMSAMMFAALILCSSSGISLKRFLIVIVAMISIIIVIMFLREILTWLADTIQSERLTVRLNRLIVLLDSKSFDAAGGSLAGRFRLVRQSVISWTGSTRSILFGVGEHRGNEIIGHHGQLIDLLASYGLICSVILINLLRSIWNNICFEAVNAKWSTRDMHFLILYIFYLLRGLIGTTLHASVGVFILVVMPITFSLLNEEGYE